MNIVITGASRGIGYETVKQLAMKGTGCIIAVSRNKDRLNSLGAECRKLSPSATVIPLPADLEKLASDPGTIFRQITGHVGHIDGLINNAGYLVNKSFEKISVDEMQKTLLVNFTAHALLIRELLPLMGIKRPSHVVSISSMGGFQGSSKYPGLSCYSASKAALAVLSECLAEEYKNRDVSFNCLALGAVQTEMLAEAFPGYTAPMTAGEMAGFIADFTLTGHRFMNGKILPVALSNP